MHKSRTRVLGYFFHNTWDRGRGCVKKIPVKSPDMLIYFSTPHLMLGFVELFPVFWSYQQIFYRQST